MVAEVAVAGQPDPSVDHDQLAAEASEVQRLSGNEAAKGSVRLLIHHQSPVVDIAMIVVQPRTIQ
jgi:hypothetical protein